METPEVVAGSVDLTWAAEPSATIIGIVIAAFMVMWQQRATARAELKLKLFEVLRTTFNVASNACGEANTRAMLLPLEVDQHFRLESAQPGVFPEAKIQALLTANGEAGMALGEVQISLEQHEIASEHFEFFRRAILCIHHDMQKRWEDIRKFIISSLLPGKPWNADKQKSLETLIGNYCETVLNAQFYLADIQVETQNELLKGLFGKRKAPRRTPPDPRFFVVRLDEPYRGRLAKHIESHPAIQAREALIREAAARAESGLPGHGIFRKQTD